MKKETKTKFKIEENANGEYTTYVVQVIVGKDTIPFKATRSIYNYFKSLYPKIEEEEEPATIWSEDKCFVSNRQKIEYIEYRITTEKMPTSIKITPEKSIGKDLALALIHVKASLK